MVIIHYYQLHTAETRNHLNSIAKYSTLDYERQPVNVVKGRSNCSLCGLENIRRTHRKYDYDAAVELYQTGKSSAEVAEETGCNKGTLLREIKRRGIPFNEYAPTDPDGKRFGILAEPKVDRAKVSELYEAGMSQTNIAKELSCSPTTICGILRKLGFPPDPERRAQAISAKRRKLDWELIQKMSAEGRSNKSIAAELGCDKGAVSYALRKMHS